MDHIEPHKGNKRLFFDKRNLQAMNQSCHNSRKASEERGGVGFGWDEQGEPINPRHDWYVSK